MIELKKTKYRNGTSQDAHHIDNRRLNRCFADYGQKLIYVYTHKNASESIRRIIPVFLQNHHDYESIHDSDRFNKFWIVRNPFDRAISSFQEIRKLRTDGPYYITERMEWFKCPIVVESFELFLAQIKGNYYDPHCFPQVISLFDKDLTEKDVDVILFDNLNYELRFFFQKYKIKHNELIDIHKSHKKIKRDLEKLIKEKESIQKTIIDLYPEDYEIYQYHKKNRKRQSVKWVAKHPSTNHREHFSINESFCSEFISKSNSDREPIHKVRK